MNTNLKIITFGAISGLIWSIIVFRLSNLFSAPDKDTTVLLALGIATGIAVSFAFKFPLARGNFSSSIGLGFLALPIGGFIFGFLYAIANMTTEGSAEISAGTLFVGPFVLGIYSAFIGISMYYLFPVAVLTTILLRAVIRSGRNKNTSSA